MPITRAEITEGVAELLEEFAGVNPSDVADDKRFRDDLDVDSLTFVEVIVGVEERFHIRIADELVQTFVTVGDLVRQIEIAQHEIKA